MRTFIEQALAIFHIEDPGVKTILIVYACVVLIIVIFRVLLYAGYQTQQALVNMQGKELTSRDQLKNIKAGLLGKVVKDYSQLGEKGISSVDVRAITDRYLLDLRLIFWRYPSVEHFVLQWEKAQIFIGILLVLFLENLQVYGFATLLFFFVMRIMGAIFDFDVKRERLRNGIISYVQREVGQYYLTDTVGAVHLLRTELIESAANQSAVLASSIEKLSSQLSGAIGLITEEITKNVSRSIDKITGYGDVLKEPMEQWQQTLEQAADYQKKMNHATEGLENGLVQFKASFEQIFTGLKAYGVSMENNTKSVQKEIGELAKITSGLKEQNKQSFIMIEGLGASIDYVEKNQALLEESLNKYQLSLEQMTASIGEALGSMVSYHLENAYTSLNKSLEGEIQEMVRTNNQLADRIQDLFEQMQVQTQNQVQTVLAAKEQIDMQLKSFQHSGLQEE